MDENSFLYKLCEFLGFTVLFNTAIYKFPQMYNILSSGSSQGVSLISVSLEMIGYTGMLTYQYAMEYPLHTFMENVLMVGQDWMLMFVILYNRDQVGRWIVPYIVVYLIGFVAVGMYWLSEVAMLFVIGMTTPVLCWSKFYQLSRIHHLRDPGQLSTITWFITAYDTGVRMFTTAVITQDIPMFINLSSSEILNVLIFFSIVYFNHLKRRAMARQEIRRRQRRLLWQRRRRARS